MSIFTRVLAIFCIICSVTPSGFCYLFLFQQGMHPCLCSVALSELNVDGVQGLPPAFVLLPFQGLMLMLSWSCTPACVNVQGLHPSLYSIVLSWLHNPHKMYKVALRDLIHYFIMIVYYTSLMGILTVTALWSFSRTLM